MFKVNNKTLERRQWHFSGVFIVKFGHILHISHLILEHVNDGWDEMTMDPGSTT